MQGAWKAAVGLTIAIAVTITGVDGLRLGGNHAASAAQAQKLEIFDWWTAGGEREAMVTMFKVFKERYPNVQIVENPVAGGGGVSHRVVLQARLAAGLPPDTWQALGGAELKAYVDGGHLGPLDQLWSQLNYGNAIAKPLANTVTINGHPYGIPLNMHIQMSCLFESETDSTVIG